MRRGRKKKADAVEEKTVAEAKVLPGVKEAEVEPVLEVTLPSVAEVVPEPVAEVIPRPPVVVKRFCGPEKGFGEGVFVVKPLCLGGVVLPRGFWVNPDWIEEIGANLELLEERGLVEVR